jgi:2-(1,2-epoxy-1,2-dihydrophenyl)acetyl-CoA isomerase
MMTLLEAVVDGEERERDTQSQLGRTHDYIEGVSAFLQKRPAQFTGN